MERELPPGKWFTPSLRVLNLSGVPNEDLRPLLEGVRRLWRTDVFRCSDVGIEFLYPDDVDARRHPGAKYEAHIVVAGGRRLDTLHVSRDMAAEAHALLREAVNRTLAQRSLRQHQTEFLEELRNVESKAQRVSEDFGWSVRRMVDAYERLAKAQIRFEEVRGE